MRSKVRLNAGFDASGTEWKSSVSSVRSNESDVVDASMYLDGDLSMATKRIHTIVVAESILQSWQSMETPPL